MHRHDKHFGVRNHDGVAIITLERGKVNAINLEMVERLRETLDELAADCSVCGIVLTGDGAFFSFGFDIPELCGLERAMFRQFVGEFAALCTQVFMYPKPMVAAINGHAVAGGWMLAQACDHRFVSRGKIKLGLNEVRFGAALWASSIAILNSLAPPAVARRMMLRGDFLTPEQALELGLVDSVVDQQSLVDAAINDVKHCSSGPPAAYAAIKRTARLPILDACSSYESESLDEFVDLWYSNETRDQLKKIIIRQ